MWRPPSTGLRGRGRQARYYGARRPYYHNHARGGRYNSYSAYRHDKHYSRGSRGARGRGAASAAFARKASSKPTGIINIDGSTYTVCSGRKSLQRVPDAIASGESDMRVRMIRRLIAERKALESKHDVSQQSGTHKPFRHKDKVLLPEQYCLFYIRFGKCDKIDSGCPYVHDDTKISVCKKYLRGACEDGDKCLLTHAIDPGKMPVCWHYLRGICLKDPCPYRHVKVSNKAPVCQDFQKGYCADGDKCLHQHILVGKHVDTIKNGATGNLPKSENTHMDDNNIEDGDEWRNFIDDEDDQWDTGGSATPSDFQQPADGETALGDVSVKHRHACTDIRADVQEGSNAALDTTTPSSIVEQVIETHFWVSLTAQREKKNTRPP